MSPFERDRADQSVRLPSTASLSKQYFLKQSLTKFIPSYNLNSMRWCNTDGIVSRVCVLKGLHTAHSLPWWYMVAVNIQIFSITKPFWSQPSQQQQPESNQTWIKNANVIQQFTEWDNKCPDYLQYKTAPFHRGQKSVTLLPITLLSPWTEGSPFPTTNQIQLQFLLQIHTKTSTEVRQAWP